MSIFSKYEKEDTVFISSWGLWYNLACLDDGHRGKCDSYYKLNLSPIRDEIHSRLNENDFYHDHKMMLEELSKQALPRYLLWVDSPPTHWSTDLHNNDCSENTVPIPWREMVVDELFDKGYNINQVTGKPIYYRVFINDILRTQSSAHAIADCTHYFYESAGRNEYMVALMTAVSSVVNSN